MSITVMVDAVFDNIARSNFAALVPRVPLGALQLVYVIDSTALITVAFSIYRRFIHRDAMWRDATRAVQLGENNSPPFAS